MGNICCDKKADSTGEYFSFMQDGNGTLTTKYQCETSIKAKEELTPQSTPRTVIEFPNEPLTLDLDFKPLYSSAKKLDEVSNSLLLESDRLTPTTKNETQCCDDIEQYQALTESEGKTSEREIFLFDHVDLNREQAAKILRENLLKQQTLVDPDYGHRIRAAHTKFLVEAMSQTFHQIINMEKEVPFDFVQGKFFGMKGKEITEEPKDDSQDEIIPGEDFHNPLFDAKMVHPLGRFNQSFQLYKGTYIDSDDLKQCKAHVNKKKGPYPRPISLPIDSHATESLTEALDQIKNLKTRKAKSNLNIPVLFIMIVQNYDLFTGRQLQNKEKEVELEQDSQVCVLNVETIKVEEETMVANYMQPEGDLTVVYVFTA